MSAPYRHPHYGASSSHHPQWVRGSQEQDAYAYEQGYAYDQYPAEYRDQRTYDRDYYDAYPSAYGEYDQRVYSDAQGYDWRDGYEQAHAYAAPWTNVWSNAQAALKHVDGAPAAPKKMRDAAAFGSEWPGAHPPSHDYKYNGFQQQQQRDYHSQASAAGSSRFQPYDRNSSSAPGTPTHPSMYRPAPAHRLPPAIRAAPRPTYLKQAKQASRQLSDEEARDRKLLVVLDLNGTLVFRAKSGNGRALDSVRAVPRPFLLCFLQYCLGVSSHDSESPSTSNKGKEVHINSRPHGSHFWQTSASTDDNAPIYEPCSSGKAEVIVWSSAQPANVDSMVRASFDESVRSQVLRVWARDTLVPHRFYSGKAESIKDLEIVWAELNAFAADQPSPGRLMAQARDTADQARPDDVLPPTAPTAPKADKKYKGKKNKEKNRLIAAQQQKAQRSAAWEAAQVAEKLGPWGVENTVLVDDSVAKARLQPFNQLVIPEFGKEDAGRMKKFIRQQLARDGVEVEVAEEELEYDSDLSIPNETGTETAMEDGKEEECAEEKKASKKKPIPESRLDDVLLQTIGVLETLRYQSNVSAFICNGGIKGYGQPKTALNDVQREDKVKEGKTPEFWADKGREVCEKLGIEVRAWSAGKAASATAALL
uniref:FCP1 homology domain-containing protein n=1 Tax=Kalmanozyma brasiliensis (strain GHG001) TaxID=1365824 RepID=V5EZB4_KALBG